MCCVSYLFVLLLLREQRLTFAFCYISSSRLVLTRLLLLGIGRITNFSGEKLDGFRIFFILYCRKIHIIKYKYNTRRVVDRVVDEEISSTPILHSATIFSSEKELLNLPGEYFFPCTDTLL